MKIPINYQKYFENRTIIITGVGRSGTTILGKVLGSMDPAYYLFEPAIMKYHLENSLLPILFEDYFLPIVQGRNLNNNPTDDSCWKHYYQENFWEKTGALDTREKAVNHIESEKSKFIIKTNEMSGVARQILEYAFPSVRFIHIVRNGNDVINSAIKKGWYTNEYMANKIVDYVVVKYRKGIFEVPYFIKEEDQIHWIDWNQVTRCACVWRTLVDGFPPYMTYESFISTPGLWVEKMTDDFCLIPNDLTKKHINDIRNHPERNYPNLITQIEEPERSKFINTMKKFGYL